MTTEEKKDEQQPERGGPRSESVEFLREQKDLLVSLMKHPGWAMYTAVLDEAADMRITAILEPTTSNDQLLVKEYMKGVAWAFRNAKLLSQKTIELNLALIDEITDAEEIERIMNPQNQGQG